MKIKRKQKIEQLAKLYLKVPLANVDYSVFNAIIIDSIGVSGLKRVKEKAWKT